MHVGVGKQMVLDRIHQLGCAPAGQINAIGLSQTCPQAIGHDRPRRFPFAQFHPRATATHQGEDFLLAGRVLQMGTGHTDRVDEPAGPFTEHVILGIGVTGGFQGLRMGLQYMVGLSKRLLYSFPVGGQHLLDVEFDVPVFQRPVGKMRGQHFQMLF